MAKTQKINYSDHSKLRNGPRLIAACENMNGRERWNTTRNWLYIQKFAWNANAYNSEDWLCHERLKFRKKKSRVLPVTVLYQHTTERYKSLCCSRNTTILFEWWRRGESLKQSSCLQVGAKSWSWQLSDTGLILSLSATSAAGAAEMRIGLAAPTIYMHVTYPVTEAAGEVKMGL